MNKYFLIVLISVIAGFSGITYAQSQYGCQNAELSGVYLLVADSDGTTPRDDATITLTLAGNSAEIHALMPDVDVTSAGSFSACKNLITISFDDFDFSGDNTAFEFTDGNLTLPFVVLGGVEYGTSTWKRISGGDQSEDQANNENGNNSDSGDSGSSGNTGSDGNSNGNNTPDGPNNDPDSGSEAPLDPDSPYNNFNLDDIDDEYKDQSGHYTGLGFGYEVRFKHTAGDFASQFTGKDKNDLPFEGDKVIMTLMVEHTTLFDIYVNEEGEVTGKGEITYNLIPNLCGVAMLTEQVNSVVNLMAELTFFYDLGKDIGQASVKSFEGTFLGLQGEFAQLAHIAATSGKSISMEVIGTIAPNKIKALDLEAQQSAEMCKCAAGIPSVTGGAGIGPSTLQEMIKTTGVDIAKGLFMDMALGSNPVGMLLAIPGVTQIQYYYKGLQNGPETRYFDIKGYMVDGQLYLQMDGDVYGGSKDLTLEYMVNYEKETPTFPTWSPFTQGPANLHPAGDEFVVYERIEKFKTGKFKDAATGKMKEFKYPYYETEESRIKMPITFGTFHESGQKRNGVSVWHEYEYYWNVYKTKPEDSE